tara:strand:- start:33777 stop:34283 length:507 start_codon:yes stop_codon:yes gene_type:complete
LLLLFLNITFTAVAQESSKVFFVKADNTWSKEIIPFPVDWLPKLTIIGFEELRFAPNWSNLKHEEFWSLIMVWQAEAKTKLALKTVHFNLNHYFTELMKPNHWATDFPKPILKLENLEDSKDSTDFKSTLIFFDGFYTGKVITVNILASQTFCKDLGISVVVFRLHLF